MVKNYLGKIIITVLAAVQLVAVGWYIHHDLAQAYVRYGPAAQLNVGDIKSLHILDGAILSADMANYNSLLLASSTIGNLTATSSVSLPANSVTDAMVVDTLTATNYLSLSSWFGTTTDVLDEGTSNQYWTNTRFDNRLTATTTLPNLVVDGAKLTGLASIPVGAGVIPAANLQPSNQLTFTATSNSDITSGRAVIIANGNQKISLWGNTNVTHTTDFQVGHDSARTKLAASSTRSTALDVSGVAINLAKAGGPTDNFIIALQADTAGNPSGTNLASVTIAGTTLSTTPAQYNLYFATTTLAARTSYWLVFSRSGAIDVNNRFLVPYDSTGADVDGAQKDWNGSSWASTGPNDNVWTFITNSTAGQILPASASQADYSNSFVGFAVSTVGTSTSLSVIINGQATGLSGLALGGQYYLGNATGTLSTSAGINSRKVCIADSATTCIMTSNW